MSGIIGHTMYALLGARASAQRDLPVARIAHRHLSSYLCGAYLGADVGTIPSVICQDTGTPVGYGSEQIVKSPLTGGPIKPWRLNLGKEQFTPREIHNLFYGRAHVAFGWAEKDKELAIPWEKLPQYFAAVIRDARQFHGSGERQLAYSFGWMTHVIGDGLIKSVAPGMDLHLLNGKYTPANRPIQDLITFHEIGKKEMNLNWHALLADLVDCPIEPLQAHYMRIEQSRGQLSKAHPVGWEPGRQLLLLEVMAENRRYQRIRNGRILKQLALRKTAAGWQCNRVLSERAKGLKYPEMVALAEKANFRHALWQVGEAIADIFSEVVTLVPEMKNAYPLDKPNWQTLTREWRRK
tara:strand:- start:1301 stop:2356 length:1056 start_codon:yes stop_codon:yes gene_type:complete